MKIVVFDAKPYDIEFFDKWNETFGANITYFEEKLSLKNVMLTKYQDVVCTFVNDDLNAKVLDILSKNGVRVIAARCAGYNNIDLKAARENRITVLRVPAYSPYAVAEHALALLMSVNRKTHKAYNRTREGNFSLAGLTGMDLHGKTAGIIGTGKIARIFIKILNGLGMKVIAYDKFPNEQAAKEENFTYMTKDEVVKHEEKYRKGSYKNDVWNKNFEEMAQKTVVKKLLKWLPVSVEFLEMAAKDEKSFKVIDDKSAEVQEIEILENNGDIINAETGEFITESGDNKDIDKVAESLFPDNN